MNYILAIIFLSFSFSLPVFGAEEAPLKNAGFVQGNIWYSKTPFFAGDRIRIYTIIFNGSTEDLVGSVEFLDNGTPIGKSLFSILDGGRVRDVWVDWTAKDGKHTITARIVDVSTTDALGKKKIVVLENSEAGKNELQIDFDTDGDGIGNTGDLDDDNDGVPDIDEVKNGTDPLKKDTDGNGISDGKELELIAAKKISAATSTDTLGGIAGAIKTANDAIPNEVRDGFLLSANAIERFRAGEGYQFQLAKEAKMKEIESIKERNKVLGVSTLAGGAQRQGVLDTVSSTAEKPFAYVTLAILTVLQYLFEWKVVFYGVALYVSYRLFKWIIRRVRGR